MIRLSTANTYSDLVKAIKLLIVKITKKNQVLIRVVIAIVSKVAVNNNKGSLVRATVHTCVM